MDDRLSKLLKEYDVNVDLWKHYDNLRQDKNKTFLTANAFLAAGLGAIITSQLTNPIKIVAVLVISVFGYMNSRLWDSLLRRNSKYILFRRYRLICLEKDIVGMSTFTEQEQALKGYAMTEHKDSFAEFEIKEEAKESSTTKDAKLATLVKIFWIMVPIILLSVWLLKEIC